MNKLIQERKPRQRPSPYHKQLTRNLLLWFLLALAGLLLLMRVALFLWGLVLDTMEGYYPDSGLYRVMLIIEQWLGKDLIISGIFIVGLCILLHYLFSRAAGYVEEVVTAAAKLTEPGNDIIRLSEVLKSAEDELNLARERALRNALLAKEAEQRKNDLVVYLAHDLKTPLTSVIGYLTLLRDEPDLSTEQRSRYTDIALDKAERLEELINEFFDITRFNLTTLTLEKERINLSRMLEQIANEFDPILVEKALTWKLDIAPGIDALCDPDKLERVFDNLIRNAVNYSYPDTEISLSLCLSEGNAVIQVQNQGRTISPEKLSRIFEQFFRLDSSRATATGGAGLGLAIAKEIAEAHGGTIRAESADEHITFTLSLPL